MPVDFLSREKQARYGRYSGEPTAADLARSFYLDDRDREVIAGRRGDHLRLGFAVQLCTVRYLGTFLPDPTAVPSRVITHVAAQVGVADMSCLLLYGRCETTWREHAGEIQRAYGYRDFSDPVEHFRLVRWLYARLAQRRGAQPALRPGHGAAGRAQGLTARRHGAGPPRGPRARPGADAVVADSHVNLLGRYEFALPESIARGAFRPLRNPSASDDEAGYASL